MALFVFKLVELLNFISVFEAIFHGVQFFGFQYYMVLGHKNVGICKGFTKNNSPTRKADENVVIEIRTKNN